MAAKKKTKGEGESIPSFYSKHGPEGTQLLKPASAGGNYRVTSSGLLSLDMITGTMGIRNKRIVCFAGDQNTGKSTACYRTAANWIKDGGKVLYWDAEGRYDPDVAAANGVPMEDDLPIEERNFHLIQYDPIITSEQATATFQQGASAIREFLSDPLTVASGGGLVVIDSLNAISADQQDEVGEGGGISLLPRLYSQWLPQFVNLVRQFNGLAIVVKQFRANIVTGPAAKFAPKVMISGGKAFKYYESLVVEFKRVGREAPKDRDVKSGFDHEGDWVQLTTTKNTAGPYGRVAKYLLSNRFGPDDVREIILYGEPCGIIRRAGAYYTLVLNGEEVKLGAGMESVRDFLYDNLELMEQIKQMIREKAIMRPENPIIAKMDSVPLILPDISFNDVAEPGDEITQEEF